MNTRRRLLRALAGVSSAAGFSGCTRLFTRRDETDLGLGPNPHAEGLPERQHAWNAALREDEHGNHTPPRYHTVLLLGLRRPPTVDDARTVERAMRAVEGAHEWGPGGLLHMLTWGSEYFDRLGELDASPIEHPVGLSRTEEERLETFDAALVLSSDDPSTLVAVERAMFHGADLDGTTPPGRLGDVFDVVGRRTGFVGSGLPAEHADAEGVPDDAPIPEEAPLFMGFKSNYRGTQASEDRVTVSAGRFAGGTTMHLSRIRISLDGWYGLDESERVNRMFSPTFSAAEVESLTDDVPFPDAVREHAREHGVVGHQEKNARVRRDGEPLILRRDFNTVDGGHPGVHFLSLQRSVDHFRRTRKSMNGWYLRDDHDDVAEEKHNGILNFITTTARANFYVPPRSNRAFPSL